MLGCASVVGGLYVSSFGSVMTCATRLILQTCLVQFQRRSKSTGMPGVLGALDILRSRKDVMLTCFNGWLPVSFHRVDWNSARAWAASSSVACTVAFGAYFRVGRTGKICCAFGAVETHPMLGHLRVQHRSHMFCMSHCSRFRSFVET